MINVVLKCCKKTIFLIFFLDSLEGPTQASDFGFTAEQPFALPDLHIDGKGSSINDVMQI
jgi:hypothetical protein